MKDFYPTALGSATAGLVARVICHPIDTVKSRLQAGQSAFRAQEGIRTLFRGLGAVVVGGVPGVCIYMTSYEVGHHLSFISSLDYSLPNATPETFALFTDVQGYFIDYSVFLQILFCHLFDSGNGR